MQQSNTQFKLAGLQESGPRPGQGPFVFAIGFRLLSHSTSLFPSAYWGLFPEGEAAQSYKDSVPILRRGIY